MLYQTGWCATAVLSHHIVGGSVGKQCQLSVIYQVFILIILQFTKKCTSLIPQRGNDWFYTVKCEIHTVVNVHTKNSCTCSLWGEGVSIFTSWIFSTFSSLCKGCKFSNKCKLKVKRTTHRREIIALLVGHLGTHRIIAFSKFFSPECCWSSSGVWICQHRRLGYSGIHNLRTCWMTQCQLPACHTLEDPQNRPVRKKMLPLLLCYCYLLLLLCIHILTIPTLSLNGKTYLTESLVCRISTSTEDVVGKSCVGRLLRPFPPTLLHLNNRHLCHLQEVCHLHRLLARFRESPSSHQTLCIVFQFIPQFWNFD